MKLFEKFNKYLKNLRYYLKSLRNYIKFNELFELYKMK